MVPPLLFGRSPDMLWTNWCWRQGRCWTNVRVEESPLMFSLLLRWRAVCRSLCRLHGNGLCHFPYFGDEDRHANRSVQLQMVKWWVSCSASQWLVDSGLARVAFPQDFQRAPNMSLACKVPGDCIGFWKSGHADLHQMIPHIVSLIFLHIFPPQTPLSSTCTSFPTARRGTTTSCTTSSERSRQRWARVRWPNPV